MKAKLILEIDGQPIVFVESSEEDFTPSDKERARWQVDKMLGRHSEEQIEHSLEEEIFQLWLGDVAIGLISQSVAEFFKKREL